MKRLLKACLPIVCLLTCLAVFGQENYQDGYIVSSNRDTVRGEIDFREWVNNPSSISFRDKAGKTASYTPEEAGSFYVSGEIYRSYKVRFYPFSLDPVVTTREGWNSDPYDSVVYLRLITGGNLSLYLYKGRSNELTYYFAQKLDAVPAELRVRSRVVEADGHQGVETDLLYRSQLAGLLADCGQTAKRARQAAYAENALRKLFFAYNNCGKDTTERRSASVSNHGPSVRFSPMIGYLHSSVHMSGDIYEARLNWPAYSTFAAGVGMEVLLPRARESFSFFTDLLFAHFSSASNAYTLSNFITKNEAIDFNQLKLGIQFRYRYPEGKVRPFINAGFSNSMIINNKSYQNDHNSFDNTDTHGPIFGVQGGLKSFQIGIIGGGGITAGRWSLEARIERLPGISDLVSLGSPMTNYYLLAGFRL
jgi:hypothetical protein